ncbi:MAG: 50S ribosomal protein L10 [Acidimicrobiales bacterium]|nr:50S ribosomal protein L10 [Acidimicrobiales bacterium]
MGEPRADKVAVVEEVKAKLDAADGVVLTEYRGLDVPAIAELRRNLASAGGEYKIYKNTLVKLAANELGLEIDELLVGPTALAFVGEKPDGSAGDAAAVAKALKEYSKSNEALVLKGGVLDGNPLTVEEIKALADLPSREVLFSEFAGAMESMFQDFAGGLDNKLREFVYAMQELVDKGGPGGGGNPDAEAAADDAPAEESADEEQPAEASADAGEEAAEASADAGEEE